MRTSTANAVRIGSLLALVLAAGCTEREVTPAAFAEPAVTLVIGGTDYPGSFNYTAAQEYARRVSEASGGTLTVELRNTDDYLPRWNQTAITMVQEGEIDLLIVQGQAWDAVGVESLTALYVPFLVRDEEHLDAVVTSDVADELLAGLEGTGVSGLGIVPGGMRRLFNGTEAPVRPADIAGDGVRVAYSQTIWAMLEAAGAHPDDPNGPDADVAFRDGRVSHLDSMFALADGTFEGPKAAADLATYPLAFTIVVNDDVLESLSAAQREALASSARGVARWAADTRTSEADAARALCARKPQTEVVLAGAEAIGEWHAATADLRAELRSAPAIDALADRIEAIGADTPPAPTVEPCSGAPAATSPSATESPDAVPNVPAAFPEGLYRKVVDAQDLIDQGVNEVTALENAGTYTLAFQDGHLGDPDYPGCPGSTYEIVDGRVIVRMGSEGPECSTAAGEVLFSGGWRLEGSSLTFTDVRSGHGNDLLISTLFGGEPWTKIG